MSVTMRAIIKIITDFTGCVQFRHANEMGGLYWTFNNIVTVATLFLALNATEEKGAIEEKKMATLWRVAMYLAIAEFVTFAVFLLMEEDKAGRCEMARDRLGHVDGGEPEVVSGREGLDSARHAAGEAGQKVFYGKQEDEGGCQKQNRA